MYLRGQQLRFSQNQDPASMPYLLDWAEEQYILKNDPSGLIGWGIAKILPIVNNVTPEELPKALQSTKIDGTDLYQHGFWNLLARGMSPDAYELARTLIGYDCLGSNANAVDLICEYFDFTPNVHYYLFNQGYDSVPWQLEKRFKDAGGEVIHDEWVAGFDSKTLPDGSTGVELHFRGDRQPITAGAMILAMPKRSLELLLREGPVFGPRNAHHVQSLIGSVRAIPLYKLFVAYEYPWWQAVGVSQGRTLTDTPVRQLYYWPVDPTASAPSKTGNALLMAYNDATNVDFWEGLSGSCPKKHKRGCHGALAQNLAGDGFVHLHNSARAHPPPKATNTRAACVKIGMITAHRNAMVQEMHRQIMRIHNVEYAPDPVDAAFMDWSIDPYGGGVHFWNRGFKSWDVLHEITQPVKDFPCYICGEAYSTNQTWVEGALQTAEIVLQKHLGLKQPKWITPNPPATVGQSAMEQKLLQVQAVKDTKS